MDAITLRYLISLTICEKLDMHLMDVVTTYLYGSLENEIYMKIPERFKIHESYNSKSRELYSIKLNIDLVGYADAGYLSNTHKARSQTCYMFTCGGTTISWRFVQQTITTTSSNHA